MGKKIIIILLFLTTYLFSQDIWQPLEKQPDGGTIHSVLNFNDSVFLAGTMKGNIYKTFDSGQNWNKVFENFNPNLDKTVGDMVFIDEQNIFASVAYEGLYKSTDFGENWNKINQAYGNLVLTNFNQRLFSIAPGNSIIYTTDAGNSWITVGLPSYINSTDIAISNDDSKWLLSSSSGVYLSTDSGISWSLTSLNVISNRVVITENNEIFVGTNNGIFYSVDFGNIWSIRNQGLPTNTSVYNISIITDSTIIITSNRGAYISYNKGIQWQTFNSLLNKFEVKALSILNENDFLFGTKNGIYLSEEFDLYRRSNGINEIIVNSINQSPNYVIASTELGLYFNDYQTDSWIFIDSIGPINIKKTSIDSTNIYFNYGENFYTSTDEGFNWVLQPFPGICTNIISFSNHIITFGFYIEDFYLPPATGLAISSDFGENWTYGGLQSIYSPIILGKNSVNKLFIGVQDIAFTFLYTMCSSNNFGFSTVLCNDGLTNSKTNCIEADLIDNIYAGTDVGIYKSSNDGDSWELFGLANSKILSLKIDSLFTIYVRTDSTIYKSSENGINFTQFMSGLENITLGNSLFIDRDNFLYIGTNKGIYRTTNKLTSIESENCGSIPNDFILFQNFPNPFNPKTRIAWKSPISGLTTVKIYNVLGKEIVTLLKEDKTAGEYFVDFEGTHLSSGIYFYQIKINDFIKTNKMMLLK